MNRLTLLGAGGTAGGGAVDTTPILLKSAVEGNFSGTNAAPRVTTIADAPAGSVIVVAVGIFGGTAFTGFSDGVNSYTADPTGPITPLFNQTLQTFSTGPIGAMLPAGTSIGPNTDAAANPTPYMIVLCFPGATAKDPEAGTLDTGAGTATAVTTVPSNANQPQYAAFFVYSTASVDTLTTPYTDTGGSGGQSGGFGWRGWTKKITTTGSTTVLTATYPGGGGGITWVAAQRTISVSS